MQVKQLSRADAKVLAQVFDPESAPNKAEVVIDPSLPAERHINDQELLRDLRARERQAIACIEQFEKSEDKSESAKERAYRAALPLLDELIAQCPEYSSAWNNRAQLRRWRFGDRNTLCQTSSPDQARTDVGERCVQDLHKAIELASPSRPHDAVSPSQGKLLAQAYTQLGAVYYAAAKDLDSPSVVHMCSDTCATWTKDRFEEEASRSFYLGGLYGNEVAKALAVHTNPHARLCGNIVKEAMRKELAGLEC